MREYKTPDERYRVIRIKFDYGAHGVPISLKGPTGFDSKTNGDVSMSSAGIQLVNLMTHTFKWR